MQAASFLSAILTPSIGAGIDSLMSGPRSAVLWATRRRQGYDRRRPVRSTLTIQAPMIGRYGAGEARPVLPALRSGCGPRRFARFTQCRCAVDMTHRATSYQIDGDAPRRQKPAAVSGRAAALGRSLALNGFVSPSRQALTESFTGIDHFPRR